jgi:hypothetical protein
MSYLRGGDPAPIARVIEHNKLDLIALAALLAELVSQFQGLGAQDDPRDKLACARVAERAGDPALATALAGAATDAEGSGAPAAEAWLLRARVARRAGDGPRQEEALLAALKALEPRESRSDSAPELAVGTDDATQALTRAAVHLALAKHLEHARKDYRRALTHAARTVPAEDEEQAARRIQRLRDKGRASDT